MAFTDQILLAQDVGFRQRVRMAAVTAAIQIAGEAKGSMSDAHYAKRQSLAQRVLLTAGGGDRSEVLEMFAWACAQNVALSTSSSDSDLQFTVDSVWDDCAGVSALDG